MAGSAIGSWSRLLSLSLPLSAAEVGLRNAEALLDSVVGWRWMGKGSNEGFGTSVSGMHMVRLSDWETGRRER